MARRPLDLTLYLVTDAALCGPAGVTATAAEAARAGATVVQLREPECSDEEFVRMGKELRLALDGTNVPLIVNDRAHLAADIGADGVHVGQRDLDVAAARRIIGPDGYVGLSVQTLAHVRDARVLGDAVDYLGVGPVWAQRTKHDAAAASGPDTLAEIVAASPWPCVAIGGVDRSRVAAVRRAGAAGIAVVSAVCGRPDVTAATTELRTGWEEAR